LLDDDAKELAKKLKQEEIEDLKLNLTTLKIKKLQVKQLIKTNNLFYLI
jgi:hypothetical protein